MVIDNLRAAYRSLRAAPGYSLVAILSLSVGIGGNLSVFTLVNAVVLKPLAYPDSQRLVLLTQTGSKEQEPVGCDGPPLAHSVPPLEK